MQTFGTEGDDYSPGLDLCWPFLAFLKGLMIGCIFASFPPSFESTFQTSFTAIIIKFLYLHLYRSFIFAQRRARSSWI